MAYTEDESGDPAKTSLPLLLLGSAAKASQHLKDLHSTEKRVDTVDNLMTPTLGEYFQKAILISLVTPYALHKV